MSAYLALVKKDLLLELRTRESLPAMVLFALSTLVIFHFALGQDSVSGDTATGVLWVTILFAAMLGLSRLFVAEQEDGAIDSFLLAPVDRTVLFAAKATVLFIYLTVLEIILIPAFLMLLFGPSPAALFPDLLLPLLLANFGVATAGTLVAALAINTRARELIVPLLGLPLLVPLVIAAAKATSPLLLSEPAAIPLKWVAVLGLYGIVFALLAYAVFDYLFDD